MSLTTEKCIEGWTNSLRQLHIKADIAFFGDSLTYWGDFASVFPDKVVCNLGLRGDTIGGMIDRIEQLRIVKPDVVFLMAGINDVSTLSENEFCDSYERLVDSILEMEQKPQLIVQSLLPVNETDFNPISCSNEQVITTNSIIADIARDKGLKFVDLFSTYQINGELPCKISKDGIHLLESGYEQWLSLILEITN